MREREREREREGKKGSCCIGIRLQIVALHYYISLDS